MTGLLNQLRFVAEDLSVSGVPWALIGALAVSVHTEPRTTRDIDVAICLRPDADLDTLVRQLVTKGYSNPQILMHLEPQQRLGTRLQIRSSGGIPVVVDLLSASSGIEDEVVRAAERLEMFPGVMIPVALRSHLIAMKVLSMNDGDRIKDTVDLQMLLRGASADDVLEARCSAQLMQERGFSRGKNLLQELERALAKFSTTR